MEKKKRIRINLTVDSEILDFAKKWSYVTGKSLSRLFDDFFLRQSQIVHSTYPGEYLSDPDLNPNIKLREESEKRRVSAKQDILRLKEKELNKKDPNPMSLKMFNSALKSLDETGSSSDWDDINFMDSFTHRWEEVFGFRPED